MGTWYSSHSVSSASTLGWILPVSHRLSVVVENPSAASTSFWVSPAFTRAAFKEICIFITPLATLAPHIPVLSRPLAGEIHRLGAEEAAHRQELVRPQAARPCGQAAPQNAVGQPRASHHDRPLDSVLGNVVCNQVGCCVRRVPLPLAVRGEILVDFQRNSSYTGY